MSLKARLTEDMKQALKAGDKSRLSVVRMALAAIKQREVDDRVELDDGEIVGVIEKMIKQRRESASQYRSGNREDLATKEEGEVEVLSNYLPEPLSDAEIEALIGQAIEVSGAQTLRDMGKVMGQIKVKAQGRVDMGQVGERVKALLGGH
ncbi:MAG: glutamyl-tRNA amidotransferase [Gammaproteobacteria bacterium SG8_31]|jgi:uncharacterized protein YqeY|nr:MAG: glutamyl-tRNA amidotransferase [Gammaproteobacteria bacterium SG8_31]